MPAWPIEKVTPTPLFDAGILKQKADEMAHD